MARSCQNGSEFTLIKVHKKSFESIMILAFLILNAHVNKLQARVSMWT
jgi:hypothetical protein